MAVVIILIAAMLSGVGFVLQQRAAEQAPKSQFLRLRLFRFLVVKPRWLLGITVMVAGDVLGAWALGHLRLSLAEPLLTTSLIFALVLAVPLSRQQLHRSELAGGVLLCLGVAGLAVAVSEPGPGISIGSSAYWPAAAGVGVLAYAFVRAGRRRTGDRRATLTGVGSGLLFGVADALTRRTVEIMDNHSFAAMLTSWPAYGTIAATLLGLWLMESAFNAGPVHASLPGVTAGEPVAGMLLGVLVFGDVVRVSAGMIALQGAGLVALAAGVVMVARGPALSGLRPSLPALSGLRPSRPARRSRSAPAQAPAPAGGPAAVISAPAHPGSVSPPAAASTSPE